MEDCIEEQFLLICNVSFVGGRASKTITECLFPLARWKASAEQKHIAIWGLKFLIISHPCLSCYASSSSSVSIISYVNPVFGKSVFALPWVMAAYKYLDG